jgi:hypothetical protein
VSLLRPVAGKGKRVYTTKSLLCEFSPYLLIGADMLGTLHAALLPKATDLTRVTARSQSSLKRHSSPVSQTNTPKQVGALLIMFLQVLCSDSDDYRGQSRLPGRCLTKMMVDGDVDDLVSVSRA